MGGNGSYVFNNDFLYNDFFTGFIQYWLAKNIFDICIPWKYKSNYHLRAHQPITKFQRKSTVLWPNYVSIQIVKSIQVDFEKLSSILISTVKNCYNQRHFWPAGSWGGTFIISICKWNATSSMVGNQVNSWYDCRISIQLFGFNGGD